METFSLATCLLCNPLLLTVLASLRFNNIIIKCVHMTSRRSCWRSKQRNGGHLGGMKYSFGDWTLFLCKSLLLFHYANMASGHMSELTLFLVFTHVTRRPCWCKEQWQNVLHNNRIKFPKDWRDVTWKPRMRYFSLRINVHTCYLFIIKETSMST